MSTLVNRCQPAWLGAIVLVLVLSGCATPHHDGRERFVLDRPHETVQQSLTGRFVIRARLAGVDDEKGGQGTFEWLQYGSREVLMLLGPLGQSAGTLELSRDAIKTFDDQGRRLDDGEQLRFLRSWLGDQAVEGMTPEQMHRGLIDMMGPFRGERRDVASAQPLRQRESVLALGSATVSLRIVFDRAD